MVKRLTLPAIDCGWLIDQLVAERQNGQNAQYFNAIHIEWRTRALSYSTHLGDPNLVANWPAIESRKITFINLYDHPKENQTQYGILQHLRDRELQLCPGCGEEGTPNTLDHYFPKNHYPHFSVLPANLAPMCDICQSAKGTNLLNSQGQKIFVHPYFDTVGDNQVFKLTIQHPYDAPHGFILEAHPSLMPTDRALVERHMEGLDLQKRYSRFFRQEYMRLLKLAREAREAGEDIGEHLPIFKRLHGAKSKNIWPHIFFDAVCADEGLIDYLRHGHLAEDR